MTAPALSTEALADAVENLPRNALSATRQAALAKFVERGFPTTRLEDWKYTDLGAIVDISRRWLENGAPLPAAAAMDDRIAELRSSFDADWLVLANGRIMDGALDAAIPGITIRALSDLPEGPDFERPLTDFNAALLRDGLHISIGPGAEQKRPLGLLIIDSAESEPGVSQIRIDIEVASDAHAQLIEYHTSMGNADHYSNSVIACTLAEGASADYVRVQNRDLKHSQTQRTNVRLEARSVLRYCGFDLGGQLIRNDLDIDIAGSEADASINGLYIAGDGQHIDNHVRVDHRVGPARSAQEYRGILGGHCRCVWNGKAIVHKGADGTDAEQGNHNLLLTERAEIDAKPELEIYADEVKCSHGTTVGQLDEAALFYLRTRGLDKQEATRALTRAFGASIVSRLPIASMSESLAAMIESRLCELANGELS